MVSVGGVPSRSVMRSNWCTTFFPGNNGFPVSISANMHPMLQISIAGVYCKRQGYKITKVHQQYFSTSYFVHKFKSLQKDNEEATKTEWHVYIIYI